MYEFAEAVIAGFVAVVTVIALTAKLKTAHSRRYVEHTRTLYQGQLLSRRQRGEAVIPSVDEPPVEAAAEPMTREAVPEANAAAQKAAPPPAIPVQETQEPAFAAVKSTSAGRPHAQQLRQAIIWGEILGKRGGRGRR